MSEKPCAGGISTWTEGLKSNGLYFEGYVNDVDHLLEHHRAETVTTYGTRRSRGTSRPTAVKVEEQENAEVCTQ